VITDSQQFDAFVQKMAVKLKEKIEREKRIDYTLCAVTDDWYQMCKEYPESLIRSSDGQFTGGYYSETYQHPIIRDRIITFDFDSDDVMTDCYSILK
jgi:hypothetical protein